MSADLIAQDDWSRSGFLNRRERVIAGILCKLFNYLIKVEYSGLSFANLMEQQKQEVFIDTELSLELSLTTFPKLFPNFHDFAK